jgi:hypothetical protein
MSVKTEQPLPLAEVNPVLLENGPIRIRILTDSDQDSKFAAKIMVDAFERKFVHVTSKRRYISCIEMFA